MKINQMQAEVDGWINKHKCSYWGHHEIFARLVEETGELAREINHEHGPKQKKTTEQEKGIEEELGDILFTLICIANKEGIDLKSSFEKAMAKCYERDKERYEKK